MTKSTEISKKIVIIGSSGMLGKDLMKSIGDYHNIVAPTHSECDITNWTGVETFFRKIRSADLVINCAAYTNVDKCETEASKIAFTVNSSGVQIIAKCTEKINAPLIHISTDYVFDGTKDTYSVSDKPENTRTIYGRSKLLGEQYIQSIMSRYFIVRTSWLYGQGGKNFVNTVINLAKQDGPLKIVNDQIGCPTFSVDLASAIVSLIESDKYGIHHASGEGSCSWYEFAKQILAFRGIDKETIPISTRKSFELFPQIKAPRPQKSVLKNTLPMRKWEDALKDYLSGFVE